MSATLLFFLRHWRVLAAVLVLSALLGVIAWQDAALQTARADTAQAVVQTNQCRATAELQNAAVQRWQRAAETQAQQALAAAKRIQRLSAQTQARVQQTLTAPVPLDCTAAVRWGAQRAVEMTTEWEVPQ